MCTGQKDIEPEVENTDVPQLDITAPQRTTSTKLFPCLGEVCAVFGKLQYA